uniref:Peptidase S1 domain-containing protein n=1 Tax=Heliothis virescens TaxID=7102 RepID=A0A2A4J845_HELVI
MSESKSGKKNTVLRIIGGSDVNGVDYPYIVKIEYQIIIDGQSNVAMTDIFCTGAVLAPTWTLTAGHCLELEKTKTDGFSMKIYIRYGTLENNSVSNLIFSVQHPAYRQTLYNLNNDIALLKTEKISLTQYARVSALDFTTMAGQEVILTGFGLTNTTNGKVGIASSVNKPLQLLRVVIVHCNEIQENTLKPAMCLARRCGMSSGLCPGDSGGPMIHASGIVGVNSIGPYELAAFCTMKPTDPVYDTAGVTPTSPFVDWITVTTKDVDVPVVNKFHQ